MEELIRKYKLAKTGDKKAIQFLLSNMGDGKLLKQNSLLQLEWLEELAGQGDKNAYMTLFTSIDMESDSTPLYVEPDFEKEEKRKKLEEQMKKQIIADTTAWKEQMNAKKIAEEEAQRKAEEEAKREAEAKAKAEAEEKARREAEEKAWREAEEKAKREAEENAQKAAERERYRLEQEQKRAEEAARKQAEEERREQEIVNILKDKAFDTLQRIVESMVHVKGGTFLMGSPGDELNQPHLETVEDFWISEEIIYDGHMKSLVFEESSDNTINVAQQFVKRLSLILGCSFDLPPASALEYALRGGENYTTNCVVNTKCKIIHTPHRAYNTNYYEWTNTLAGANHICLSIKGSGNIISLCKQNRANFRLFCSNDKIEEIQATYKEIKRKKEEERKRVAEEESKKNEEERIRAKEERRRAYEERQKFLEQQRLAAEQEKEAKLKEKWCSLVNSFIDDVVSFEYESGFFFNKKKVQVRYLRQPVNRLKNAIMQMDSLVEWEKQDILMMQRNPKKNDYRVPDPNWNVTNKPDLNRFLNKLNEYKSGVCTFDFLHNNKDVEERLRKLGKIAPKGAYLIIK